ncbi:ABC transporter permease [Falsibacillus albus]|uniref:ABC transporter permease n=1 Tax=Falsibacillus albus TaxID=2478915 RepID=A0A3L7JV93_9BACI|nr:ABC transporter permease [Falsibacillus albus]RLQ94215.1 ABC transporter permease [Falsibacillus albus]
MIRFIWQNWWRNKERFILLLVGALIVSTGLSYLVGVSQSNNGTIVDELQKRWKSSYHIVVRASGSRSVTEDKHLLEPNYLSGLAGGITMDQYHTIKSMNEIDVAAPIAMLGYVNNDVILRKLNLSKPGVYRLKLTETTNDGVSTDKYTGATYFTIGGWQPVGLGKEYGAYRFSGELSFGSNVMLAGIDPEAEEKLVGLGDAINKGSNSRYFNESDHVQQNKLDEEHVDHQIPIILSDKEFVNGTYTYDIERLDLPFGPEQQSSTMENVKAHGGRDFLEKQKAIDHQSYTFTTEQAHQKLLTSIFETGKVDKGIGNLSSWLIYKPSPVKYEPVTSPFSKRWPFSYEIKPYSVPKGYPLQDKQTYRPVSLYGKNSKDWARLQFQYIGLFDPQKLDISKDPLTELPMETYFPSKAQLVLDDKGKPVNPPVDMKPLNNSYGFLTKPPLMLTTIEAAADVIGDKPISAIRIKVKGVDRLTKDSQSKLEMVAKKIEDQTGLITDITLGSSPQPALTHIPGIDEKKSIGWVQQPWIKIGSSFSIFQESKMGLSGVIGSVILVAIVYVFSSNLIMMYARKKEFAVLLSLGWRPSQLTKLIFMESTIIGMFVSIISWLILGFIFLSHHIATSGTRIFMIGVFGIAIYWLGSIIPGLLVMKIKPYEAMRTGEITTKSRRIVKTESFLSMGVNYLLTKWKRSILSIFAIALPASLLIFFLFITFRLKGIMFTTWLGQYVAMEVGPMHYIAMGVAVLIAVLTTAEIIWQNVSERQPEIALLKAVGWHNRHIRGLVLLEGAISGFIAGIVGFIISMVLIWRMYDQIPYEHLLFFLVTLLIPITTGILGAVIPAEKAVKIMPYQGIQGVYDNSKRTEQYFKYVFSALGLLLFIGSAVLLAKAVPEVKKSDTAIKSPTKEEGTKGVVHESIPADAPLITETDGKDHAKGDVVTKADGLKSILDNAWKIIELGESVNDETETYTFGKISDNPKDLPSPKKGMGYISIPVGMERNEQPVNKLDFKPFSYELIDGEGNHYYVETFKILENKNWNGNVYLTASGKAKALITYQVPNETKKLYLLAHFENLRGDILVKVK